MSSFSALDGLEDWQFQSLGGRHSLGGKEPQELEQKANCFTGGEILGVGNLGGSVQLARSQLPTKE